MPRIVHERIEALFGFRILGDLGAIGILGGLFHGQERLCGLDVQSVLFGRFQIRTDHLLLRFVVASSLFVLFGVGVEPPVAEQAVVGPVGGDRAHRGHADEVHQEHHDDEDGDAQDAVGHHAVDLLRGGHAARRTLHAAGADGADGVVALVGDDRFGIVVHRRFQR